MIQSLEVERDQYLKDFGSNRFSFVREITKRVVEQNKPAYFPKGWLCHKNSNR